MAAYVIGIRDRMKDPAEMALYGKKALPTMSAAEIVALYGRHEVLEGEAVDGIVIVRFESYDAARTWYESAEYKEAMKHRLAGADYRVMLVDGV